VEDEIEVFDIELIRLREKQSRCSHSSTKCSLCGKYHDLIKEEHTQIILNLIYHIKKLEHNIDNNGSMFFSLNDTDLYDIIKPYLNIPIELVDGRISAKRHCEAE
jgi:hypothetical protein